MQTISIKQWNNLFIYCGISAFTSYFLAAFAPLPDKVSLLFALSFGPFLMLSSIGLFFVLLALKDSISLRIAVIFNIVATSLLTLMLVVQLTAYEFHKMYMGVDRGNVSDEHLKWIFKEVNSIQLGIDVTWDIFISLGTFFFAFVLFSQPLVNKAISILGMVFSVLLLVFNLTYFPVPPDEAGSIDFGPFVAIWYLALIFWFIFKRNEIHSMGCHSN